MKFSEYQKLAIETAIYPKKLKILYPCLGLAGETGEVCEKIKKVFRDQDGKLSNLNKKDIEKELGDVLWYIANICEDLELSMEMVALVNLHKLRKRKINNTLSGSGDNR